jgi:hypothetical protein
LATGGLDNKEEPIGKQEALSLGAAIALAPSVYGACGVAGSRLSSDGYEGLVEPVRSGVQRRGGDACAASFDCAVAGVGRQVRKQALIRTNVLLLCVGGRRWRADGCRKVFGGMNGVRWTVDEGYWEGSIL